MNCFNKFTSNFNFSTSGGNVECLTGTESLRISVDDPSPFSP